MTAALAMGTRRGYAALAPAVLGTGIAILDGTVVNVALRHIGRDLDASLSELQWVSNGYLLALAALILLGGSLGDRFGRRRVFVVGVVWFAVASLVCGLAQTPEQLIGARLLQGVGGALLTPGSLAMIQSAFRAEDRGRAIGAWSGLSGIATAIGPFLGGWLVDAASWRWIFLINIPLAVLAVLTALLFVPESADPEAEGRFDLVGAALAATSLAAVTVALIQAEAMGAGWTAGFAVVGVAAGAVFLQVERSSAHPMMPLGLFRSRLFSASNMMTLLVYAALGAVTFFLVLQLQTVSGYTALEAGMSTLPITIGLLLLSSRAGALSSRIGPRLPMSLGPLTCAVGTLLLIRADREPSYWFDVFPGVLVFAAGLTLLVAPLTATVLAAAPDRHAGIASGINNAVARSGTLLAIAAIPVGVGLRGEDYDRPSVLDAGFERAMVVCSVLLALGGLVSWLTVRRPDPTG